jgi:hypothetical protein
MIGWEGIACAVRAAIDGRATTELRLEPFGEIRDGARGRNRTSDTAIFNRMLYQLSYPGTGLVAGRRV